MLPGLDHTTVVGCMFIVVSDIEVPSKTAFQDHPHVPDKLRNECRGT